MAAASASLSSTMRWAVGGWSFFIIENVVLSENRKLIIDELGERNYHSLYGTISTAACASIAYGYMQIRGAPPLQWAAGPPSARIGIAFGLQAFGLASAAQFLPKLQIPVKRVEDVAQPTAPAGAPASASAAWSVRCPFDFTKAAATDGDVFGPTRISRHLGLWSFASVCLGAAVVVPSAPQAACLSMPTLVALIGGAHTDSRHARGMGGELPSEVAARTSNVPFVALLTGAQGSVGGALRALADETKVLNAACAAVAAALWACRWIR